MADTVEAKTLTLDRNRALRTIAPDFDGAAGETLDLYPGFYGDELVGYVVRAGFRDVPSGSAGWTSSSRKGLGKRQSRSASS